MKTHARLSEGARLRKQLLQVSEGVGADAKVSQYCGDSLIALRASKG